MIIQAPKRPPQLASLFDIGNGVDAVVNTVNAMVRIVRIYKPDPQIYTTAREIVSNVAQKNYYGEAKAVQEWVRDNIRYTQDVADIETLQTPDVTIYHASGDCDDKSILTASLLLSLGHPVRFKIIGPGNGVYEHVYVQTKIGQTWYSAETTENVIFGWEPPYVSFLIRNV
jgi:transglutaminase-like putative cysteine protease